jgi:hypothetical protein
MGLAPRGVHSAARRHPREPAPGMGLVARRPLPQARRANEPAPPRRQAERLPVKVSQEAPVRRPRPSAGEIAFSTGARPGSGETSLRSERTPRRTGRRHSDVTSNKSARLSRSALRDGMPSHFRRPPAGIVVRTTLAGPSAHSRAQAFSSRRARSSQEDARSIALRATRVSEAGTVSLPPSPRGGGVPDRAVVPGWRTLHAPSPVIGRRGARVPNTDRRTAGALQILAV